MEGVSLGMPSRDRSPFNEIEQLLDRLSGELDTSVWSRTSSLPVDVVDRGDTLVVTADLPGYTKDDIDVTLVDTSLRIEADRESTDEDETATFVRRERSRTHASRTVRLPEPVEADEIAATYTRGVLEVTLPKRDADEGGHRIDIE